MRKLCRQSRFVRLHVRLLAAILIAPMIILCGGCSQNASPLTEKALHMSATLPEAGRLYTGSEPLQTENASLVLRLDPETCAVEVENKADGSLWASNPADDYEDPVAAGSYRTDLKSQLLVTYTTGASAAQRQSNSRSGSVSKKAYKIYEIANGFRVHYTFSEGFTIPVAYQLEQDTFTAMVLYDEIEETGSNLINEITLLPYFGLAGQQDEGYLFVPDGSGALIELNNGKLGAPIYRKTVYGEDPTLELAYESSRQESIRVPVFGMKRGNGAFAAVITQGEGQAALQAAVAGQKTSLNSICVIGTYRVASTVYMMGNDTGSRNVLYNAQDPTAASCLAVQYTFLTGEEADYSGMAAIYRRYLEKQGLSGNADVPPMLHMDLTGGVSSQKSFLGIQYQGRNVLTSFDDAQELLQQLRDDGVSDIAVGYRAFSNDAFTGKVEVALKPAAALGGKRALVRLLDSAEQNGTRISLHADMVYLERSGNGTSRFFDTGETVNLGTAELQYKGFHSNIADASRPSYYLVNPRRYESLLYTLKQAAQTIGAPSLYFTDTAQTLAGDYAVGGVQREKTADILTALFAELATERSLTLADPNGYLYPYASLLVDIPLSSSRHLLFDRDVPFLQLVLKGSVPYCAVPMNQNGDLSDSFLRQVETMSGVRFSFIYRNPSLLLRTDKVHDYALEFAVWREDAVRYSKAMAAIQKQVAGAGMRRHVAEDGLSVITYDNGVTVYINYASSPVEKDGFTIGGRSYVVVRGQEIVLHGNEKGEIGR